MPKDNETIGLGDILGTPVAVTLKPVLDAEPDSDYVENVQMDDEPEPISRPQQTFFTPETSGNNPPPDYEQEPEPQSLSPDDIAVIAVNMLDGLQRFGFALARKKMLFTEEEQELLGHISTKDNVIYQEGTKEAILQEKYRKHLDVIKDLPFNDGEKQRLTDATKIYARTTQIKVSPFTGLLLAYSEVLGMRAVTVFSE